MRKERWSRGTVINQEGSMVNVQVDSAVMCFNQSKVRRDHDEWHDVAIPGLEGPEPKVEETDDYEPDVDYAEAYLGEQEHWFYQSGKSDVVELFSSNTGLSWHLSKMDMSVGQPIDHKNGFNLNSKAKQADAWKHLEKIDPEYVLISNPSPNAWKYNIFKFCLEVMEWQNSRGKGYIVITPPDSGFATFLDARSKLKKLSLDMKNYVTCDDSIRYLCMYLNHDDATDLCQPRYAFKNEGKPWTDPQWKSLPSRLCSFIARVTRQRTWIDRRQSYLMEDLLREYDDGALCGTSLMLDRGVECSCLLQDMRSIPTSIPVPLKHILPQKFTTPMLVQTLRKIDQLPRSTEASVKESTDPRIMELIPGLANIRQKTLPQMYFEQCSVYCGTYGRVHPLFQQQEDAVLLIWKPGDYDHVFFMFVSQLYPHHELFKIQGWSVIVFSRELSGAIRRMIDEPSRVDVNPPDIDDAHPDNHGYDPPEPPATDVAEPLDPDDDDMPDYPTGPDPDDDDESKFHANQLLICSNQLPMIGMLELSRGSE